MKKTTTALLICSSLSIPGYAQEAPFQQMLEQNLNLNSRESTVQIQGVKYKKIEIDGGSYYIVFKGRTEEIPHLLCERPQGYTSESLIEGSVKIEKRKSVFAQILKESCKADNGKSRTTVELDPQVGIQFDGDKKSVIKNKKIGVNPLKPTGVNFSGEF